MPVVGLKFRQWPALLLALYLVAGCTSLDSGLTTGSSGSTAITATTAPEQSPAIAVSDWVRYTEDALLVLEANYLWRDLVDWGAIREAALSRVRAAPTAGGAHQALSDAIASLNDPHSHFQPTIAGAESPISLQPPEGRSLEGGSIGYLFVPSMDGDELELTAYAAAIQEAMRRVDGEIPVCGWVVDLRGNGGGSIFGMLLGLGPILGEGVVVSYESTQETAAFEYRAPSLYVGDESPILTLDSAPYVLADPTIPVAVLIGGLTGSAGEGVLVAFLGRPATRTFGTATAGLPTSPRWYRLPDGAYLVFTDAAARDRNGQVYESEIPPDERVIDLFPDDEDDVALDAATAWLSTQQSCGDS